MGSSIPQGYKVGDASVIMFNYTCRLLDTLSFLKSTPIEILILGNMFHLIANMPMLFKMKNLFYNIMLKLQLFLFLALSLKLCFTCQFPQTYVHLVILLEN